MLFGSMSPILLVKLGSSFIFSDCVLFGRKCRVRYLRVAFGAVVGHVSRVF